MNFFQDVYKMTKKIPRGRVATYGQIAAFVGNPRSARQVGWALHSLDAVKNHAGVPWQRVVNRQGMISTTCLDHPPEEQAQLLRKEGVSVVERGGNYFIDLKQFLWHRRKNQ